MKLIEPGAKVEQQIAKNALMIAGFLSSFYFLGMSLGPMFLLAVGSALDCGVPACVSDWWGLFIRNSSHQIPLAVLGLITPITCLLNYKFSYSRQRYLLSIGLSLATLLALVAIHPAAIGRPIVQLLSQALGLAN